MTSGPTVLYRGAKAGAKAGTEASCRTVAPHRGAALRGEGEADRTVRRTDGEAGGRNSLLSTHIVLLKLREPTAERWAQTRDWQSALESKVLELRHVEVRVDELRTDRSRDLALTTRSESWSDLEAHKSHPFHSEVLMHVAGVAESTATVDCSELGAN